MTVAVKTSRLKMPFEDAIRAALQARTALRIEGARNSTHERWHKAVSRLIKIREELAKLRGFMDLAAERSTQASIEQRRTIGIQASLWRDERNALLTEREALEAEIIEKAIGWVNFFPGSL